MEHTKYFPTVEAIEKASGVLEEILTPTPFQKNNNLSDIYGAEVYLKREDLQMVRSYKIRGAYNKIRSIAPENMKNGIVCASAGNHAQGVAFSCSKLRIMGSIFMPVTTPKQKIEQVRMFGREYIEIVEIHLTQPMPLQSNMQRLTKRHLSRRLTTLRSWKVRERSVWRSCSNHTNRLTTSSSLSEEEDWPQDLEPTSSRCHHPQR